MEQESSGNRVKWRKENRKAWTDKWTELKLNSSSVTGEKTEEFIDEHQPHLTEVDLANYNNYFKSTHWDARNQLRYSFTHK